MDETAVTHDGRETDSRFDVAICGGGLVGLALANALKGSGLRIAVIDAQQRPRVQAHCQPSLTGYELDSGYAPRVSALNSASVKLLQRLGAWGEVNRSCAFRKMLVRDSSGSAHIEFTAAEINLDSLGHTVENREVLFGLTERLGENDNVTLYWHSSLESAQETDSGYSLQLKTRQGDVDTQCQLECQLLIGADGGNSRIRQLSNMKTVRWNYGQDAVVSTIKTQNPHQGVARQWFTSQGPLALLPLDDPNLCSIVWSTADAGALMAVQENAGNSAAEGEDAEAFCARLTQASEGELGKVLGTDQRFCFPLQQQHSLRYVKRNLALLGDAAHTIHPLAGQGANLGFADAEALASELAQSRFTDDNVGSISLLRRYERIRQPQNLLMMSLMEAFKRLYGTDDPGVNWLRNTGMKFVNDSNLLKTMVTRLASGI